MKNSSLGYKILLKWLNRIYFHKRKYDDYKVFRGQTENVKIQTLLNVYFMILFKISKQIRDLELEI